MASTLSIWNYFTLTDARGIDRAGRQGASTDDASTSFDLTATTTPAITGTVHSRTGSIATATYNTIYNSANDFPATFDYLFYVADQDTYLQLIGTATDARFKIAAKVPFTLSGFGSLLGSAGTTVMSSEPTVTAIAKVVVGNVSGSTALYELYLVD